MSLIVREGVVEDAEAILEIARHPLVAANQYRLGFAAETAFRQILSGKQVFPQFQRRIAVIEFEGKIVGYIHHTHGYQDGLADVEFGWNLHPNYWGRGIMPAAIDQLVNRLQSQEQIRVFVAECFSDNSRCIRVIEKLGFRAAPISLYHRIVDAMTQLCLKWVLRFELKPSERPAASQASRETSNFLNRP